MQDHAFGSQARKSVLESRPLLSAVSLAGCGMCTGVQTESFAAQEAGVEKLSYPRKSVDGTQTITSLIVHTGRPPGKARMMQARFSEPLPGATPPRS